MQFRKHMMMIIIIIIIADYNLLMLICTNLYKSAFLKLNLIFSSGSRYYTYLDHYHITFF